MWRLCGTRATFQSTTELAKPQPTHGPRNSVRTGSSPAPSPSDGGKPLNSGPHPPQRAGHSDLTRTRHFWLPAPHRCLTNSGTVWGGSVPRCLPGPGPLPSAVLGAAPAAPCVPGPCFQLDRGQCYLRGLRPESPSGGAAPSWASSILRLEPTCPSQPSLTVHRMGPRKPPHYPSCSPKQASCSSPVHSPPLPLQRFSLVPDGLLRPPRPEPHSLLPARSHGEVSPELGHLSKVSHRPYRG